MTGSASNGQISNYMYWRNLLADLVGKPIRSWLEDDKFRNDGYLCIPMVIRKDAKGYFQVITPKYPKGTEVYSVKCIPGGRKYWRYMVNEFIKYFKESQNEYGKLKAYGLYDLSFHETNMGFCFYAFLKPCDDFIKLQNILKNNNLRVYDIECVGNRSAWEYNTSKFFAYDKSRCKLALDFFEGYHPLGTYPEFSMVYENGLIENGATVTFRIMSEKTREKISEFVINFRK